MTKNKDVNTFINKAPTNQKELLKILRKLIAEAVPEAIEQYKWSRPVYATAKDFCYLVTAKKYVTLGFMNFEKITQQDLLEGTGKSMRHIKIPNKEKIDVKLFSKMLQEVAVGE